MEYKYFKDAEFKRCTPSCRLSDMDEDFMLKLDNARALAGVPFYINSAFRSVAWEHSHGRSGNSLHTKRRAVDISCTGAYERYRIVLAALDVGFHGIGIGPNFIHLDNRETVKPLIWLY